LITMTEKSAPVVEILVLTGGFEFVAGSSNPVIQLIADCTLFSHRSAFP